MSTKKELRDQVIAEMNARRIDHKTYIDSEWLLSEYETTLRKEQEEAVAEAVKAERERIENEFASKAKYNEDFTPDEYNTGTIDTSYFLIYAGEVERIFTPQNTKTDPSNAQIERECSIDPSQCKHFGADTVLKDCPNHYIAGHDKGLNTQSCTLES